MTTLPPEPFPWPFDGDVWRMAMGLRAQEMERWLLTGGVVCFPSHWMLPYKLGKPLPGIHRPVARYDAVLATPMDRFFDTLSQGRVVWRANWTLSDDPTLFQPRTKAHVPLDADIHAGNAGDRLWLRVERQTLTKLPDCGAILFTIRTHQRALSALSIEQRRQFAAVLRSVPDDVAAYKGLRRIGPPAVAFCEG